VRAQRLALFGAIAGPLLVPGMPRLGWAQTAGVDLSMDCPALGEDGLAALEARTRAELASRSLAGKLTVCCASTSGVVAWAPPGEAARERGVPLGSDRGASIDALLEALHALIVEGIAPEPPATPLPPAAADVPPVVLPRVSRALARHTLAATIGVDSELWSGAIAVAVGGHLGARIAMSNDWSLTVLAGPEWGLGNAGGIRAWALRTEVSIDFEPIPNLRIAVGVTGRALWIDGATATSTSPGKTGGGLASLRYVLPLGAFDLSVGPTIEALVRPVQIVEVGGSEIFRIPSLLPGLSLEASTRDF
jgi:hypothetical protein